MHCSRDTLSVGSSRVRTRVVDQPSESGANRPTNVQGMKRHEGNDKPSALMFNQREKERRTFVAYVAPECGTLMSIVRLRSVQTTYQKLDDYIIRNQSLFLVAIAYAICVLIYTLRTCGEFFIKAKEKLCQLKFERVEGNICRYISIERLINTHVIECEFNIPVLILERINHCKVQPKSTMCTQYEIDLLNERFHRECISTRFPYVHCLPRLGQLPTIGKLYNELWHSRNSSIRL